MAEHIVGDVPGQTRRDSGLQRSGTTHREPLDGRAAAVGNRGKQQVLMRSLLTSAQARGNPAGLVSLQFEKRYHPAGLGLIFGEAGCRRADFFEELVALGERQLTRRHVIGLGTDLDVRP